ncbi:hypothetical protein D3C84_1203490 [compost metagenome]
MPPPLIAGRLNDGSSRASSSFSPTLPLACNCSALITSMGEGLSVTVRGWPPRLPVTTTVFRVLSDSSAWAGMLAASKLRAAAA